VGKTAAAQPLLSSANCLLHTVISQNCALKKENESLREENESLKNENESLKVQI
jgi:cell division protein FtsB